MEKFIPKEKLSKKAKKALNARQRKDWNGLNPVTRRPENPKAYNRKKLRREKFNDEAFLFYLSAHKASAKTRLHCSKESSVSPI